jgi:ribonuclease T2
MGRSGDRPGCFDFYVFQMTWRPTFCASHASYDECRDLATNRHAPLWGVHGLWPQYRQGWPETCDASPGCQDDAVCPLDRRGLPSPLVAALQAVMPGYPDLADHEWRKHGTCTGLNQIEYFEAIVTTVDALKLSKAIEKDADQKMSVREIQDATGSPAAILTCEAGPYNEQTLLAMTTCWKIGENASVGERMSCPANVLPKQRCRGGRPIAVPRPAGHVGPIEENDTQDSDSTATVDQSSETTDDKSAAPSRCKSPAQGPECSIDADCPAHGYSRCAKRSKCCTR